ncbi:hypothetical protein KKG58_02730 [Patescibacteria group bacterium]|nr:hypothetical protein [Patescibacteria group bacterium]
MNKEFNISAFFPAYNEEENIIKMSNSLVNVLNEVADDWHNYYFDFGGYRFFIKSIEINKLWHEILLKN